MSYMPVSTFFVAFLFVFIALRGLTGALRDGCVADKLLGALGFLSSACVAFLFFTGSMKIVGDCEKAPYSICKPEAE